ncbi:MAG TPA: MFS transporter [Mycobacteriales bacterium]|nr:MFS transporter [Mycobacteriales bacterium]
MAERTIDEGALARRDFVPSEREHEHQLGAAYSFMARPVEAPDPGPTAREALMAGLRGIDPRTLGAPALPIVIFSASMTMALWDVAGFNVLAPDIQKTFHTSTGFIVALGTIVGVVGQVLAPLTGYMADRVNRVRMLASGAIIAAVAQIGSGRAGSTAVLAGTRAAGGVGAALAQPAAIPLVADYYPVSVRARVMSMLFIGFGLGSTIGPLVTGQMSNAWGWRTTFVVLGVVSIVVVLPMFLLKEPPRGRYDRLAQGASETVAAQEQPKIGWAEGWRAAASISTVRRLWIMTPILAVAANFLTPLFSLYFAQKFGLGSGSRGALFSAYGGIGLVMLAGAGPVSDKIIATRPGRMFTVAGVLIFLDALVLVGLVLSPWLWLSIPLLALPMGVGLLILPGLLSVVTMVTAPRFRGFAAQTTAPFQLIGFAVCEALFLGTQNLTLNGSLVIAAVVMGLGSFVVGAGAPGVERDMRAAAAASSAEEISKASRDRGENTILICRDVDVTYETAQVLFNVDLQLAEGELVALLGTNGAGKSTLLRAICGLQEASNGAIFFDGIDVTHAPPYLNARAGIVYMPGGAAVFPSLTVAENLRSAAWIHRTDEEYVESKTAEVLDLFPALRERLATPAGTLSGGEQQMVALGQAFLMRPKLLMIDELSLGLAPVVVEQLLDIVRRINDAGTTILLVEQSANVALTIARRAIFMDKGEIRFDGPTEDLLARGDLLRAVFLGGTGATASGYVATQRRDSVHVVEDSGPVLEVHNIHVGFGGRIALEDLSISVEANEVLGMIGPNGAGKTTLFDVISGYVRPGSGTVRVAGTDCTGLSPDARARAGLARSFQNARLFPALTVRENIAVALERRLTSRSAIAAAAWLPNVQRSERRVRRRVDYLIDLMHLGSFADKFARELSTGSRRLVDIACIMAAEPKILLLDEPSSGLAQSEVEVFAPVVRRLAKETSCGVVVIEHDIPLVTSLSDRMVAVRLGSVLCEGTPADVVAHPEVVRSYLGASEATINRSGALPAALAQVMGEGHVGHG